MHIVHLSNTSSGDTLDWMKDMAQGYAQRGHEVTLVVAGATRALQSMAYGQLITLPSHEIPGGREHRVITDINGVTTLLDELAPDRVEVSDRMTLRNVGWWAHARSVPNLMWAHERADETLKSVIPTGVIGARAVVDAHNRGTVRRFDRIACASDVVAAEFARIGAHNIVRVPWGVDLEFFHPGLRDGGLRSRLVGDDDHLIVLSGRVSRDKRPDIAIRALAELRARGIRARLVILGSGPRMEHAQRISWGLPIDFLGVIDDTAERAAVIAAADIALMPGLSETSGWAALEFLACGTPVVASRASAIAEIVTGAAGLCVESTPVAFADAIEQALVTSAQSRRPARERAERYPRSVSVDAALALHEQPVESLGRRIPRRLRRFS
jgi:alpha-1,6-mannosyltransferase